MKLGVALVVVALAAVAVSQQFPIVSNSIIPVTLFENLTEPVMFMNLTGKVSLLNPATNTPATFTYSATTMWELDQDIVTYSTVNGVLGASDETNNIFFEEICATNTTTGETKDQLLAGGDGSSPDRTSYAYSLTCDRTWKDLGTKAATGCSDPVQWLSVECYGGRRSTEGHFMVKVSLCEQSLFDYVLSYHDHASAFYWNATLVANY